MEKQLLIKMKTVSSQYLFIYSSLRKGFHQDRFNYITRYFNFISNAKVKGILSVAASGPVATPTNEDHFIKGELYDLKEKNDFSWVFGQLDDYEGLIVEQGEQPSYRREITSVVNEDGSFTTAWISGIMEILKGSLLFHQAIFRQQEILKD